MDLVLVSLLLTLNRHFFKVSTVQRSPYQSMTFYNTVFINYFYNHCVKSVQIWSYFWFVFFLVFGLNTEIYKVNLRIQSKYKKIRFSRSANFSRHKLYEKITAQKIKFPIKDFFSKCDWIRSFLWIWSHLLKKSLMKNLFFCAVNAILSGSYSKKHLGSCQAHIMEPFPKIVNC